VWNRTQFSSVLFKMSMISDLQLARTLPNYFCFLASREGIVPLSVRLSRCRAVCMSSALVGEGNALYLVLSSYKLWNCRTFVGYDVGASTRKLILLPSPSLSERITYCVAWHLSVMLSCWVCVRRISLGGEGNALFQCSVATSCEIVERLLDMMSMRQYNFVYVVCHCLVWH